MYQHPPQLHTKTNKNKKQKSQQNTRADSNNSQEPRIDNSKTARKQAIHKSSTIANKK